MLNELANFKNYRLLASPYFINTIFNNDLKNNKVYEYSISNSKEDVKLEEIASHEDNLQVNEAIYMSGYNSPSYFYKNFKLIKSVLPTGYQTFYKTNIYFYALRRAFITRMEVVNYNKKINRKNIYDRIIFKD